MPHSATRPGTADRMRRLLLPVCGAVVALAVLLTQHSPAQAEEQCFTQGYDFSNGEHDYYAESHPCLGSQAPLVLYLASLGFFNPYVSPYFANAFSGPFYGTPIVINPYTGQAVAPYGTPFAFATQQYCYDANGNIYGC